MSDETRPDLPTDLPPELPAAAQRALAEAAERRKAAEDALAKDPRAKEYGGRDGLDPARYGDWEKKGIAIDF
ncbi:DUF1674 domain-containing protein [Alloyangia pacifica]|uniref:DUF1674 domain-containing protein n=1 Tax=Alloyangia pacifica TaxID=311180 RepID=A0A1I6RRC4_9RHOB|nr:DUF1674 domain-containing protein [Alloyangia pacifica]SDG57212.1 Protein of unknown function [Alloyangia pacifica]SFS67281.1 Protein of unknown function [Alloyangia pacifica]